MYFKDNSLSSGQLFRRKKKPVRVTAHYLELLCVCQRA